MKDSKYPKEVRKVSEKTIFVLVFSPCAYGNAVWRGVARLYDIVSPRLEQSPGMESQLGGTVPLWGCPGRAPGEDSVERARAGYTGEGARSSMIT